MSDKPPAKMPPRPIAEHIVVSSPADPFLTVQALVEYSGLTKTKLLRAINDRPDRALPHYRVGNKCLVRRSEFDRWVETYRHRGRPGVERGLANLGMLERP